MYWWTHSLLLTPPWVWKPSRLMELHYYSNWPWWIIFRSFTSCSSLCSGVLKTDGTQGPLVSLSGSSSEQASTSKQQYSMEQQLYGASGSRDDIFSLGGPSYLTASKNCGSRTLGCVSISSCSPSATADSGVIASSFCPDSHKDSSVSSYCRAAMLDCESESSGNSHQSLLEGPSAQPQSNEG